MEIIVLVVALLAVTAVCVAIGERWKLPYPILMLVATAAIAWLPWVPDYLIDAELILPLFLPPLLFQAARTSSWSVFRTRWRTLLMLAVGLTAVTAAAVAGTVLWLVPGIALPLAIMLGAMVAPPDPVAVEAVAGPARMPRRLLTVLQTEGLFNDAVAIVLFQAALGAVLAGQDSLGPGILLDFVIGAALAVAIGFLVGFLYRVADRAVTSVGARTAVSVVAPFAAYILAEEVHASGVIAVVVTALETNRRARASDGEARVTRAAFWDVVNLMLTGLAFGLMGIELRAVVLAEGTDILGYAMPAVVVCAVVIAVRFLGMLALAAATRRSDPLPRDWREAFVLTWCGMRGLATLALALSVPTFATDGSLIADRGLVIVLACAVLLATLVPTGLTVGPVLRLLGLQDDGSVAAAEIRELTGRARTAALGAIRERFGESEELSGEQMRMLTKRFEGMRREIDTQTQAIRAVRPDGEPLDPEAAQKAAEQAAQQAAVRKKVAKGRELMAVAQTVGLDAARTEILAARSEPGVDPEAADHVLRQLDLQIMAAPPRSRSKKH
ncbi:sodium:proton antiporter [Brachybacterium phenoliresistens]|uniref:cation:proton antiporter n=1 Tax=Brachybacterium phenoliresistens TaxID=396014 RepID=UPI0031CFC884